MGSVHVKANKGWDSKEGIIEIQHRKERVLGKDLGEESIWVRDHRMNRSDSSIDLPEILN
jgi:hypothetical protein